MANCGNQVQHHVCVQITLQRLITWFILVRKYLNQMLFRHDSAIELNSAKGNHQLNGNLYHPNVSVLMPPQMTA
jgi:hypothetical protein